MINIHKLWQKIGEKNLDADLSQGYLSARTQYVVVGGSRESPLRALFPSAGRCLVGTNATWLRDSRHNYYEGAVLVPMNTVVKIQPKDVGSIAFQEASYDIWDKKYRLIAKDGSPVDRTMDDTYKRVARALADVEPAQLREQWYESFLWALRHGAIPAGRVTSNAGALEHKPATSTINCTVSGTIRDSMDDILNKVHEAG